jgi:hypothetical protein
MRQRSGEAKDRLDSWPPIRGEQEFVRPDEVILWAPAPERSQPENTKAAFDQRRWLDRTSAGGGIRTLTLFRAPAPKAGMSAIPSRPQPADRTALRIDESVGGSSYLGPITR